jgi:Arc/MetJ-type ribon-helix-helix transcriptional regulator
VSYAFPPELNRLIQEQLATGAYASEDDLLLEAVRALRDREEVLAGIQEGLADLGAERMQPLRQVDAALRDKYRIPRDA